MAIRRHIREAVAHQRRVLRDGALYEFTSSQQVFPKIAKMLGFLR